MMTSLLALAAQASPQAAPPPVVQVPPPPVIVEHFGPRPAGETLTTWRVGEARCGGEPVAAVAAVTPFAGVDWSPATPTEVTLRFRVEPDGRAAGIGPSPAYGASADLAPALAASRFAPGGARQDCAITYAATRVPVADAPVDALIGYTIFPLGRPSQAVWDRVRPAGDCVAPPPALRNRAFPDFDAIAQPPGTAGWSMIGYDLDARGRPVRARVVAGSGNSALDRASERAVRDSRFAPGARTGCLYPYWRRGGTVAAPATVERDAVRPAGATCPATVDWARRPVLSYPENFRRRSIEGWALVAFDLAPWGATGNVRVLAAEPAAAFGDQAAGIVRAAAAAPSAAGSVGCVERVRFAMGVEGGRGQVPAEAAPPPF